MAKHLIITSQRTACGRAVNVATGTMSKDEVTCKTCCNTEAFNASMPAPELVTAPPASVKAHPVTNKPLGASNPVADCKVDQTANHTACVAFDEWRHRLGGKDRLPRGRFFAGQRSAHPLNHNRVTRQAA